jgi:hypothetical protein
MVYEPLYGCGTELRACFQQIPIDKAAGLLRLGCETRIKGKQIEVCLLQLASDRAEAPHKAPLQTLAFDGLQQAALPVHKGK